MFEQPGPDSIFVSAMHVSKNQVNPLTPKSDQHQISPCNISALLNRVVMRIMDMITQMNLLDILSTSPHYFCRK